jgi:uncharacterized membrane protein YraQ (UPF0718 family)
MNRPTRDPKRSAWRALRSLLDTLPVVVGVVLLASLASAWLPAEDLARWLGHGPLSDALAGAAAGSVAAGNPAAGYVLGGELLRAGVGLVAVTALLVAWVAVGLAQLPAEMVFLGRRFALVRNLLGFLAAVLVALATVGSLALLGLHHGP